MNAAFVLATSGSMMVYTSPSYAIGAIIAIFLFGYLIYSLVRPEKF